MPSLPAMLGKFHAPDQPAGLAPLPPVLDAVGHVADGVLADVPAQARGPGVDIPLHRIERLAQVHVRQPHAIGTGLGEPGTTEGSQGPVCGYACKPAVPRHSVACLSVRSKAMRWALYRTAGWDLREDLRLAGMEVAVPFLSVAPVPAGVSLITGQG